MKRLQVFRLPKTEHFKSLTKNDHPSADHITATGHNIKWDHFDILASGKTDYHCEIKETLFKRRGVYDSPLLIVYGGHVIFPGVCGK